MATQRFEAAPSSIPPASVVGELRISETRYCVVQISEDLPDLIRDAVRAGSCARIAMDGQEYALVALAAPRDDDVVMLLSERELQIAVLVAHGRLDKQIADVLHISKYTVQTYLRRMFLKLNVGTRAQMVFRCSSLIERLGVRDPHAEVP